MGGVAIVKGSFCAQESGWVVLLLSKDHFVPREVGGWCCYCQGNIVPRKCDLDLRESHRSLCKVWSEPAGCGKLM